MARKWIDQAKRGETANLVGRLAETAVKEAFDLAEPYIEIKACCRQYYRVVLRQKQLHKNTYKTYCLVIYERPRRRINGKRQYTGTPEDAFRKPLRFYFTTGAHLLEVVETNCYKRIVLPGEDSYYHVKLSDICRSLEKNTTTDLFHEVWGQIPSPDEVPF